MVRKTILSNGIRVVSEFMPNSLSVTLGVWIDNGSSSESDDENGISHFIEHLLFKGTPTRSAHQIAHEIDEVGGILNAFTGREYVCFFVKVLHHHLARGLDLLADIVQHPLFPPDELEKERRVILQEIRMLEDTPDDRIHDLFTRTIWERHPLGAPIIGTQEGIESISRDMIVSYRHHHYRAGNVIVAAAGRVDHDSLVRDTERLFVDLEPGRFELPRRSSPVVSRRVRFVEKDLEQEHLCVGFPSFSYSHPDRYVLLLLNAFLGGSMSSRLFQEVREKRGLAYSIYSYLSTHSEAGALTVYAGTAPSRCQEVFSLVSEELGKIATCEITPAELASVREQLKGNILLSLEASDNRMTRLAKNEFYHGCYIPLEEVERQLDMVTTERFLDVASRIVRENTLTAVFLGPVPSPGGVT